MMALVRTPAAMRPARMKAMTRTMFLFIVFSFLYKSRAADCRPYVLHVFRHAYPNSSG